MKQFANVVRELRSWLSSFPLIQMLLPYGLYIMFGSLGVYFLNDLVWVLFGDTFWIISTLASLAYYTFLLGFWMTLITPNIRFAPYGLFLCGFIILFPFTTFSLVTVVRAGIFIFFGYWLLRFTASPYAGLDKTTGQITV